MRKLGKLSVCCLLGIGSMGYAQTIPNHETTERVGITALIFSAFISAQKVGINTDMPKQTLDIEGTFGFSQPGYPADEVGYDKASPLYWNVQGDNNGEANKEKIVTFSENRKRFSPFKKIKYKLTVGNRGEDKVENVDLNIDGNSFTVFLLNYRLALKKGSVDTALNSDIVYIPMLGVNDNGLDSWVAGGDLRGVRTTYFTGQHTEKGFVTYGNEDTYDNWLGGAMFSSIPIVYVKKDDQNKWRFYGDYPYARPRAFLLNPQKTTENHRVVSKVGDAVKTDATYIWEIELLVIDNDYIKDFGEVALIEKKSGNASVLSDYKKTYSPGWEKFNVDHEKTNQEELKKIKIISPNP